MKYEDLPEIKYATFETWSSLGYKVKKGSKAIWFDGISYFTEFQVELYNGPMMDPNTVTRGANSIYEEDDIPF